jgi:hypothetical protein
MKKILFIFMLLGMVQSIMAQPAARRKQAQQKAQQSNADNMTLRAKLYFPTAIPMDEDVVWRRDIYRELNLTDDANAALYYPVEPTDGKMNLFTYIFKLMFTGRVPVYQYRMDGNEDFSAANRLTPKAFVDNYHIYYEKKSDEEKKNIDLVELNVNELDAFVIPEKTTLYAGERFNSHVVMAAIDSTQRPEIYVNGSRLNAENGRYSFVAGGVGEHQFGGYILMKGKNGEMMRRNFVQKYTVLPVPNTATVAADLMNVLYAGYANPISL